MINTDVMVSTNLIFLLKEWNDSKSKHTVLSSNNATSITELASYTIRNLQFNSKIGVFKKMPLGPNIRNRWIQAVSNVYQILAYNHKELSLISIISNWITPREDSLQTKDLSNG